MKTRGGFARQYNMMKRLRFSRPAIYMSIAGLAIGLCILPSPYPDDVWHNGCAIFVSILRIALWTLLGYSIWKQLAGEETAQGKQKGAGKWLIGVSLSALCLTFLFTHEVVSSKAPHDSKIVSIEQTSLASDIATMFSDDQEEYITIYLRDRHSQLHRIDTWPQYIDEGWKDIIGVFWHPDGQRVVCVLRQAFGGERTFLCFRIDAFSRVSEESSGPWIREAVYLALENHQITHELAKSLLSDIPAR